MVVTDICRSEKTIRSAHSKIYTSPHLAIGTVSVLKDGLGPGYQRDYGEDVITDDAGVSAEHEEERN